VLGRPGGAFTASDPLIADFVTLAPSPQQIEEFTRRLGLTSADYLVFGDRAVAAFDALGPGSIGVIYDFRLTNLAERRYRGLDLELDYRRTTSIGEIGASANVVYVTEYRERASAARPPVDRLDTAFQPLDLRARFGAYWSRNGWNASLFVNYADNYRDVRFPTVREVDSETTVDVNLTHSFDGAKAPALKGLRVSLSAQNLLDADPPRLSGVSSINSLFTGDLGYDFVNASGRGRFVSLAVTKAW